MPENSISVSNSQIPNLQSQHLQPVIIQPPTTIKYIPAPPVHISKNHPFGQWSVRETLGLVQWAYLNLKGSPYQIESWEGAASSLRYIGKCAHREAFYSAKNCCMRFLQLINELTPELHEKVQELCGENDSQVTSAAEHGIKLYGSAVPGNNTDKSQCAKHFSLFKKLMVFFAEKRKTEIMKELENYESEYKRFEGYLQKLNDKGLEEKEIIKLRAEMIKELKIKSSQFSKQVQASGLTLDSEPLIPVVDANGHVIPQKVKSEPRSSPERHKLSPNIQTTQTIKMTSPATVKSEFIAPEQVPQPITTQSNAPSPRTVQQFQQITDSNGQVFRIATLSQHTQFIPANNIVSQKDMKRQPIIMNSPIPSSSSAQMVYQKNIRVPVTNFVQSNHPQLTYVPIQNINGVKGMPVMQGKRPAELGDDNGSKKIKTE